MPVAVLRLISMNPAVSLLGYHDSSTAEECRPQMSPTTRNHWAFQLGIYSLLDPVLPKILASSVTASCITNEFCTIQIFDLDGKRIDT